MNNDVQNNSVYSNGNSLSKHVIVKKSLWRENHKILKSKASMKTNHIKILPVSLLVFTSAFLLLNSCSNKEEIYPPELTKAIDLFYEENKNDSVLLLLCAPSLQKPEWCDVQNTFMAAALCEKGEIDSARIVFNRVRPVKRNKQFMYYYQSVSGLIDFRQNNNKEAYEKLLSVVNEDTQDLRTLALNQRIIGRIMKSYNDYKDAIEWDLRSVQNFEKAGLEKSAAVSNKFLGSVCVKVNYFDDAEKYLNRAKAIFDKHKDYAELFYVHIVFIDLHIHQNNLDSAIFHAHQALNLNNVKHDLQMQSHLYNNLGEIEMLRGNYRNALEMFQKTLALEGQYFGEPKRKQFAYFSIGKIYNKLDQLEKVKQYLLLAQGVTDKTQSKTRFEIYREMAKMHAPTDYVKTRAYIDSTVKKVNDYYSSQNINIVNSFMAQQELEQTKHNFEHLKNKAKVRNIAAIIFSLLASIIITILLVNAKIRKDKSALLKELVKKTLALLDEEKELNRSIQEKSKCMNRNKIKPSDDEKLKIIYSDLHVWLEEDNNFQRNDLNIELVAKEIGTNRDYLSRAISEHNYHFTEVINKYRVNEAIKILSSPTDKRSKYSLHNVAYEVGFNSPSVFIDAFRKQTGMTPGQFRNKALEN